MTVGRTNSGDLEPLVLLINLDRSRDRLSQVSSHLKDRGLVFERVAAVDGRDVPLPAPGICPNEYKKNHGRVLRPGEVGCYLSHLKAMETFLATNREYCVILEDDVVLGADINEALADLVANDLYGYDILRLQGRRYGLGFSTQRVAAGRRLKTMLSRVTGSTAYIMNRNAARKCLACLLPMEAPFDHAYDRPLHLGIRIAHVIPYPAAEVNAGGSTIELPKAERRARARVEKVGLREKISVLRWRAITEVARGLAALSDSARRALFQPKRYKREALESVLPQSSTSVSDRERAEVAH